MLIQDILARDLKQRIEEIIKVDQADEHSVYTEITEYIATDRIKRHYYDLFKGIAEAPSDPHEGIGVWISGFFGSGKSSFAKNVGYVLADQQVLGKRASELFESQMADRRISELVDFINMRIPTEVIMFDVSVDRAVRKTSERMAEIMYTMLLRRLGYAEDYDIAELEIELEREGKLNEFIALCENTYGEWRMVRKGAQKLARASALLHRIEPLTYPAENTWSQSVSGKVADITVNRFVERAFELCAVRCPGKALVFIIDEVGQYVARSADKIEDLRAIVEQFGKVGKNLLRAKKISAPAWIMVTSQERLDEVVAALDSKRVELAKLQDRFKYHIDMAPADIREVATRRVLAKKDEALPLLQKLFQESQGQLNVACHLERTTRWKDVREQDFVQFYPYLPHFVELSIDIMSGIRLQPGAPRHLGGSNRTIIKQTYEMLVSDRTALASKPLGTLVTLDKIFDLVEGNLPSEKQKDVTDITQRFRDDVEDAGMTTRVAKVISLLEFVPDLPRTEANIAACLVDTVGSPSPLAQVQKALEKLRLAQFVRNTEEGWKLQTAQEKNWDTERRRLSPRPKERNEILREIIQDALDKVRTYNYRKLKNFRVGMRVDTVLVEEGQIPLSIITAEDADAFPGKVAEVRGESRQDGHKHDVYWIFALTPEVDDLITSLYASRQMVAKYDQLSAQNRITKEEAASLSQERSEMATLQRRLREKMAQEMEHGESLFRGISKNADTLGKNLPEMLRKLLDSVVPDLYPKLEMGARELRGNEAEEVLKAANLNGLSQVFYVGEHGLSLVIKEENKYVPNTSADVAKELLDYIKREHAYGNKVTGKSLEDHFQGLGYGWERDMLRLVLAVLLRAGAIEVTYQGRRYRNHLDPQCRVPLTNNMAFKSASFAPREVPGLKMLTTAVEHFEEITGSEIDIEEGAIAAALKKLAEEEQALLLPVLADARANQLPVISTLEEYQQTLEEIRSSDSDDCVRLLAGEGKTFKAAYDRARAIRNAINQSGLALLRRARIAANEMAPMLSQRSKPQSATTSAIELRGLLTAEDFYTRMARIEELTREFTTAYQQVYLTLHEQRTQAFTHAIEEIKGYADWSLLSSEMQASVLSPLTSRACKTEEETREANITLLAAAEGETVCRLCLANPNQIDSDLAACSSLTTQVLARLRDLTAPPPLPGARTEHVKLAEFFTEPLDSEDSVNVAVKNLAEYLHKLVEAGVRIIVE